MRASEFRGCNVDDNIVDRMLFDGLEYAGEEADLIMVLGSSKASEYRVPKAAELFEAGKAPKLLFCGGKRQQTAYGFTEEYKSMLKAAQRWGLSQGNILIEMCSQSTEENFRLSAKIIEKELPECKKIILVTTAYHMRRAQLFGQNLLPQYEFIPCPVNMGSACRDNWKNSQKGRKTAIDECLKIGYYIRIGLIEDFNI